MGRECYLDCGKTGVTFTEKEDEEESLGIETDIPFEQLQNGQYNIIYTLPETFSRKKFRKLLRSDVYQESICASVIDEVHMVSEWGEEFRPDLKKLGELTCIFGNAMHLALTATATKSLLMELETVLNYRSPEIIWANPDRPNIFIDKRERLTNNKKIEKFDDLIMPVASELKEKLHTFPLTIMYVESLESLGYFYQVLTYELKEKAYHGNPEPENRIFAQYDKDYPNDMKKFIVNEIVKQNSTIRLVLGTIALGMGLNAPCIQRIIHCRPPTTMEKYMQEIARAGRNGHQAEAVLYYNNSDISKGRKGLSPAVKQYCVEDHKCLRLTLLKYFGFDNVLFEGEKNSVAQIAKRHPECFNDSIIYILSE